MLPDVLFFRQIDYFFIWLAGKICVLRVADFFGYFRNIWAVNLADFCAILDQCLVHKDIVKTHLILFPAAKIIVSECAGSFVPYLVASVQWKPCVWLGFSDRLVP